MNETHTVTGERRADRRFLLHTPVQITGVDGKGMQFAERARVEDISDLGCRFEMHAAVHRGSILAVKPLGFNGEDLADEFARLFLVIWVKRTGDQLTVGARSLREEELRSAGWRSGQLSDRK